MNVLVMGASRGIGLELVRQYLAEGDRVIATARDAAGLARLKDLGADAFLLDVAQAISVSALSWRLDGEKIDLALYVAGVLPEGDATAPPTQPQFDATLHTNVLGAMQALPQVAPWVEEAGGQFAFLSSQMGHIGCARSSDHWLYRVSKAALNMAVVTAQADYPRAQFVLLHPGWVRTDMGTSAASLGVEDSARGIRQTLHRCKKTSPAFGSADVPYLRWDGSAFHGW